MFELPAFALGAARDGGHGIGLWWLRVLLEALPNMPEAPRRSGLGRDQGAPQSEEIGCLGCYDVQQSADIGLLAGDLLARSVGEAGDFMASLDEGMLVDDRGEPGEFGEVFAPLTSGLGNGDV